MNKVLSFYLMLAGALLLTLTGCSSSKPLGLCVEMGACPEEEGCKDGVNSDGGSCDEDTTPKKPNPSHSTGEMGGGEAGDE